MGEKDIRLSFGCCFRLGRFNIVTYNALAGSRSGKLIICYIADAISIHAKRWLNYFACRGHEVHLISRSFDGGFEGFDKRIQMHSLIKVVPLPQASNISIYFSCVAWILQVRIIIKRIKPDILDAHFIGVPGYLGVASGFHPLILTAWGSDILITPRKNPVYRLLTKYSLRKADLVVCRTPFMREEIAKLGINSKKVRISFLGVNTKEFSPVKSSEELRQRLNIANLIPVVISTRALRPIYDIETLVKAIPLILKDINQAKFVIVGGGEQRKYLETLAKSLSILDSIVFVGFIPHETISQYLASSDVYVSTSLSDGTPSSLLEAMACGLAPVVTDIAANRSWIKDGENGFLVPVKDHEMLADRITLLLKNDDIRNRFGEMNIKIVKEKAEHSVQLQKLEEIYMDLLEDIRKKQKDILKSRL